MPHCVAAKPTAPFERPVLIIVFTICLSFSSNRETDFAETRNTGSGYRANTPMSLSAASSGLTSRSVVPRHDGMMPEEATANSNMSRRVVEIREGGASASASTANTTTHIVTNIARVFFGG